jgi:tetratricopeptide (TPR) repeat protein
MGRPILPYDGRVAWNGLTVSSARKRRICEVAAHEYACDEMVWGRAMKISGIRVAGALAAGFLGLVTLAHPARLMAQAATIHGHVQNPAGQPVTQGEVKLTTEKNPSAPGAKFEYTFPLDASGNYKGTVDKPGNYMGAVFEQGHTVDFMPAQIAAGEDKTVDFDMTRKEYIDKMSPADREALEEYKKKNAEINAQNAKIQNLNALLISARAATKAGNYDLAVKNMQDATAAKPDEAILWDTLGDALLGQAEAAAKVAHDAKTTDATVPDKYSAAITAYQKAISLNAALAKPSPALAAAANNQLGQAYGKIGKTKEAADAYDAAAKADPTKAGMYYYNEAATLLNANDGTDAATAADKAIAADPTKVEAYYIKAQGLAPSITTTPDGKFVAPPGLLEACNKYLELAPTGPHAQDMKDLLAGLGQKVQTTYKAGKK